MSEINSDFGQKNFKKLSKLPSAYSDEQFLAWNFFQKFWIASDFLQKPLAWFSNFYLRVQSKNSGRIVFFILLFRVCSDFERKFFQTFGQKSSRSFQKKPSKCPEEQFVAWNLLIKIWIVLDFLQKTLQWFSNVYLRVQSKKSGRSKLFILLLSFFLDFERKKFRIFGQKTSRSCQNYPLRVQTNNFWIEISFKSFEPIWIFYRNLWHGSQTSIFVSRVKIPEEIIFFILLFRVFFGFWAKIFSDLSPKNFKKFSKLTFKCPEEQFVAWIFF